ncbi:MAG: DAK2 domain-containing protein, partial [Clostridia bacterium]|nr:DAK2 domain-containing protein [Clostridia bacterium]
MENTITGLQFIAMIKSGAANLKKHVKEVNDLNVFPVPDGDTGENMLLTLNGGLKELLKLDTVAAPTLEVASAALASGMLLGARGNSGVIFSQLFAGLKKGLQNKTTADVNDLIEAFSHAVERAYAAVSNPVEGTILTVARESFETAKAYLGKDVALVDFFKAILISCKKSLDNTINLLPALKEAGVIDSGGAGLYYFMQGAASVIFGEETNFDVEKELALTENIRFWLYSEKPAHDRQPSQSAPNRHEPQAAVRHRLPDNC